MGKQTSLDTPINHGIFLASFMMSSLVVFKDKNIYQGIRIKLNYFNYLNGNFRNCASWVREFSSFCKNIN